MIRRVFSAVIVAICVAGSWTAALGSEIWRPYPAISDASQAPEGARARGERFPDFVFKDSQGVARKLSDYRGKVVILNFWASWCPPCRAKEMPELQKLHDAFRDTPDVVLLGVAYGRGSVRSVALAKDWGFTYSLVLPELTSTYDLKRPDGSTVVVPKYMPQTYVLDRNGRIILWTVDLVSAPQYAAALKDVLTHSAAPLAAAVEVRP